MQSSWEFSITKTQPEKSVEEKWFVSVSPHTATGG